MSNNTISKPPDPLIPYYADNISRPKYKENFTSIISDETVPIHLSISEYDKYILQQLLWQNPELNDKIKKLEDENNKDIGDYLTKLINKNKDIISYYEKVMLYLSTKLNKDFTKKFINDINNNNYHYSFSFWIFLIPSQNKNKKDIIYTYGNRPSMYYNHNTNELSLEYIMYESDKETEVILYKSNTFKFQKWNNIVINNNYGVYEIYINGNLIGSYNNIVNYKINDNEKLIIGNDKNDDIGGISNFYYYENPLKINEIIEIYKNSPSF